MEDTQRIQEIYTDRELWEFGKEKGFPENPEISLFTDAAWQVFSDETDKVIEAKKKAEELRAAEQAAIEAAKEAKAAETMKKSLAEEGKQEDTQEEAATEEGKEEKQQEEDSKEKDTKEEAPDENIENIEEPEPIRESLSADLLNDPEFIPLVEHVVASAMYPQNVFRLFADIGDNQLRMRGAQPIQGGPDTAFAILLSVGDSGNLIGAESAETVREMVSEIALVKGERETESFPFPPLAQLALLAAVDVVLEDCFEGARFTPSALMNAFDAVKDNDFKRFCTPVTEVVRGSLLSSITIEDMIQVSDELATVGVFARETAGDRTLYSFASGFKALPELLSCTGNRMALCRYDMEGKGDLLYVISEGELSFAFIIEDKAGRMERMNKEGLAKVLREIFPVSAFCTTCGAPLQGGARFCDQCGSKAI